MNKEDGKMLLFVYCNATFFIVNGILCSNQIPIKLYLQSFMGQLKHDLSETPNRYGAVCKNS